MKKIILASNSPRRKELLEKHGIEFSVTVSKADENIKEYNSASDFAVKASLAKAEAVLNKIKANNKTTEQLIQQKEQLENEISTMKATKSWRWTAWLRKGK